MTPNTAPNRIDAQISTFGYPLVKLVNNRRLQVRASLLTDMDFQRLVRRWYGRYALELNQAGRKTR